MLIKTRLVEKPDAKPRSGGFIIINLKFILFYVRNSEIAVKPPFLCNPAAS